MIKYGRIARRNFSILQKIKENRQKPEPENPGHESLH
jgi:hypothetical protein